ncbi:MAG: type IV pilus assembly protein PilM [Kiritimatiellae bacterium]|nr:type IV pilus assembly protein PilM [Kiritimatiellia bacterium]
MFKSNRIVALDIGDSELKIAEFSALKSGGIELARYGVSSLGIEPNADVQRAPFVVSTIRGLLRETGILPGPALVSISGQMVFPRFVKLPPVSRDKVQQIITYEAQQNVPFPIQDVVWDHQLIGGEGGDLYAMLMAIKKEVVQNLVDTVEAAGLRPQLIDVAPIALYNCARYNYGELEGCTMILDMGSRTTSLVFVDGARCFTRSIPVAGNVITHELMKEFGLPFKEAEELKLAHAFVAYGGAHEEMGNQVADRVSRIIRGVMTRLHAEVTRSINLYRSQQGGNPPERILLSGGTAVIPRTDAFFKEKMKLEVDYMNPFRNVAVSHEIGAAEIGKTAHVMGEVVGLALRGVLTCPVEIDLTPPDVVARETFRRRLPFLWLAAVGLILILVCWWAWFYRMRDKAQELSRRSTSHAEAIDHVAARLSAVKGEEEQIRRNAETLIRLVQRRTAWHELLRDIRSRMPDGMWLTSIQPQTTVETAAQPGSEESGTPKKQQIKIEDFTAPVTHIEIQGMGFNDKVTPSTIEQFAEKLKSSPFFSDETAITAQPIPKREAYARLFTILLALKEPLQR